MPLQRTEAIILKSLNHGETSKILTVYTRARGKIALMAKGARNIKSRFGGTLEPLNHVTILYYEKQSRDIQLLSQADILAAFSNIKKDLERTAYALATCELINQLEVGQEPNPLLFRLLSSTLQNMDAPTSRAVNIFRAFQIHIFDIMGFRPHFEVCVGCQRRLEGTVRFDLGEGGLVCDACLRPNAASLVLSQEAVHALRHLQKVHLSKLGDILPSPAAQNQVDSFLRTYLHHHVEGVKELKALQFLRQI